MGARSNARNKAKQTPGDLARLEGNTDLAALLGKFTSLAKEESHTASGALIAAKKLNAAKSARGAAHSGAFQFYEEVSTQDEKMGAVMKIIKTVLRAKRLTNLVVYCDKQTTVQALEKRFSTSKNLREAKVAVMAIGRQDDRQMIELSARIRQVTKTIVVATNIQGFTEVMSKVGLVIHYDLRMQDAKMHYVGRGEGAKAIWSLVRGPTEASTLKVCAAANTSAHHAMDLKNLADPTEFGQPQDSNYQYIDS